MKDNYIETPTPTPFPTDPLLNRFFISPEERAKKENGLKIVKAMYDRQTANDSSFNFFKGRNSRWIENLLWAKGSQKMTEFLDYMNVESANKAYTNLDYTQSRIAAQFMGTLIESMAKNKTYACVNLTDDGSLKEKEQRMYDALFRMHDAPTVNALQQGAGMQLEPIDAYVPDDEMAARVYFELEDRLPKAIRFEKMIKSVQDKINFERILNRKSLADLIVLNAGFTKIEKCGTGEYTVRKCIPTNMVYNFFFNSDSGDLEISEIGEFWNIKVKDFRSKFGKTAERPDGLTEKEIFDLAKLSTNKNIGSFNYMWNDNWTLTPYDYNRPYDDCSILVFDCEINCGEDVYYVDKKDSYGKSNISEKKAIPYVQKTKNGIVEQPKPDNVEIIKRQRNTWMRGVYAPHGNKMLYWGAPDIIIAPFTNVSKPLSSYTVNIPNNDGDYVPSLFERGMEVLREYQLTKLKRKQLIAKIKPSGIRIDVESARNIDLGNGDSVSWEEIVRIYDQTGCEIWSSKGVDPLQREAPPLSNTVHDESIEKVIGLTNVLTGQRAELRELWGVPVYRDGADVGDRTPAKLAEGQNESSFNVTDFILNANNQLWEETWYKLCLLHWNDIVKNDKETKDDMINTRFCVQVKTKMTEYEKQRLENDIQRYSQVPDAQGNPSITLKDAMYLREIDDYKLACWYLSVTFEQNRRKAMEESAKLQQQNQQLQQQSAMQAQQQEAAIQQQKAQSDLMVEQANMTGQKELAIITGLFAIYAKGGALPDELKPLATQAISNVMIPLVQENQQMQQHMAMQQMAQQQQMQPQQ